MVMVTGLFPIGPDGREPIAMATGCLLPMPIGCPLPIAFCCMPPIGAGCLVFIGLGCRLSIPIEGLLVLPIGPGCLFPIAAGCRLPIAIPWPIGCLLPSCTLLLAPPGNLFCCCNLACCWAMRRCWSSCCVVRGLAHCCCWGRWVYWGVGEGLGTKVGRCWGG